MAAFTDPEGEQEWSSHDFVLEHGIHDNSVLHYFAQSNFFSHTSNNAILTSQATYNPSMAQFIGTRAAFEGRLKTMSGLEFVVGQEPAEMGPGAGTGVWVIRKQNRRKRAPLEDEITVLATYYIVGDYVYMAPAVGDVLGCRMLGIVTSLQKVAAASQRLPKTEPWLGVTASTPQSSSFNTQHAKRSDAVGRGTSKEPTPLLDTPGQADNTASTSTPAKNASSHAPVTASSLSTRLLEETLSITLKYGDEYMDEHPITGTPGNFHMGSANAKAGKERDRLGGAEAMLSGRAEWERLLEEEKAKDREKEAEGKGAALSPLKIDGAAAVGVVPGAGAKKAKAARTPTVAGMPRIKRKKSKGVAEGSPHTPA